jgi:patatin-like phospholipase/acyl hydrolase
MKSKTPQRKLIKILSIDGGGIRGIIPALILQEIEKKLKKGQHLAHCFDLMSGTSTGGIIVLLLNTPDHQQKPKFGATDVVTLYRKLGSTLFYQSWWQYISSGNGWLREKYSTTNLKEILQDYFGDHELQDSLTNVIIPAYDVSLDDMIFFKSDKARKLRTRNFYYKDIARATSAAPTYFRPAQIQDIAQKAKYTLIDGGVALNNPTMSACVHASKLYGHDHDYLVISLGTGTNKSVMPGNISFRGRKINTGGKLEWSRDIVDVFMNAANDVVDYQIQEVFKGYKGIKRYHRFQVLLDADHTAFDNVSSKNIQKLEEYARELIDAKQDEIYKIAQLLDGRIEITDNIS